MRQIELLEVESIQILDLADLVGLQRETDQALITCQTLNLADLVVVKTQMF